MIKGRVTRNGTTYEIEAETPAEIASVFGFNSTSSSGTTGDATRTKRTRIAGNSVKRLTRRSRKGRDDVGTSSGKHWSANDVGIVARVIKEGKAAGKNYGISKKALRELKEYGDNPRRSRMAVSMLMVAIRHHMRGDSKGVPARVAQILNEGSRSSVPVQEAALA